MKGDTQIDEEAHYQIIDLFEPPTDLMLPTPAVSIGSASASATSTKLENHNSDSDDKKSNNNSTNDIDNFKIDKDCDSEHGYEDDSEDSEDLPIFYSSLSTTTRGGLQTPPLPLSGLLPPQNSSTPKETAYSYSPKSPVSSNISTATTKRPPIDTFLPSSPTARHVSLPRQKTVLEPGASLHVSNLHPTAVTEAILYNYFSTIGAVSSVKICRDTGTLRSLGYGYVNYYKREDARLAMKTLNFKPITGAPESKEIRISKVFVKGQLPPAAANLVVKGLVTTKVTDKNSKTSDANKLARALWEAFTDYGEIVSVRVVASDGRGYVQFENEKSAQSVLAAASLSGVYINECLVRVETFVGREARSPWPDANDFELQQSLFLPSEKSEITFSSSLVVPQPSDNQHHFTRSDGDLIEHARETFSGLTNSNMLCAKTTHNSGISATLYAPTEPVLPENLTLSQQSISSSPDHSHQVSICEATSTQCSTSILSTTPGSASFNHPMHAPLSPLSMPLHNLFGPTPAPHSQYAPPPHGKFLITVKILNLSAATHGAKEEIELLARKLCRAFGTVKSVHVSNTAVNPGHFGSGPVYVRFEDACAAVTARNVISGMQLGATRPLRAFLLKRRANADVEGNDTNSSVAERVPPMVVVRHLADNVTAGDIASLLHTNCPLVYDELFLMDHTIKSIDSTRSDYSSNGDNNNNNSSSNGGVGMNTKFEFGKSPICLFSEHSAATIVCPDSVIAAAAASALDKRQIHGITITSYVARTFDDDDQSSPYHGKFLSRRYNSGHQNKRQKDYQHQYPPLLEPTDKYSQNTLETPVCEPEPKLHQIPAQPPLPQCLTNFYIQHVPRPYVYFPVPTAALSSLLPISQDELYLKQQPASAGTVNLSVENGLGRAMLVGHYYFGVDDSGVGYHVQHPMPPPVPAQLLLQSGISRKQNEEKMDAVNMKTIDNVKFERLYPLKVQTNSVEKHKPDFKTEIESLTRGVSDDAGAGEDWTLYHPIPRVLKINASDVFKSSQLEASLLSISPVPNQNHVALSLPVMTSVSDPTSVAPALKPLRSRYGTKQFLPKLLTATTVVESSSSECASVVDNVCTGSVKKFFKIPAGPAKQQQRQHQHEQKESSAAKSKAGNIGPAAIVVAEGKENGFKAATSTNSKSSKNLIYRQRRKLFQKRRYSGYKRSAGAASVVADAADETLLPSSA